MPGNRSSKNGPDLARFTGDGHCAYHGRAVHGIDRNKGTSDVAKKNKTLGRIVLSSALNRQGVTLSSYGTTMVLLGNRLVYRPWCSTLGLFGVRRISPRAGLPAIKKGWLFQVFFSVLDHKLPREQIWPVTIYMCNADHFSAAYPKKD